MSGIIINSSSKVNINRLKQLAEKLGEKYTILNDSDIEDFALGTIMKEEKTGNLISKEEVIKKLKD